MKLLLDEHYANEIAQRLRRSGLDVETVSERGLNGMDDEPLFELCAREGRVLMTNNARDFVPLARSWNAAARDHAGLVLTSDNSFPRRKRGIGRFVAVLAALMEANTGERPLANQVRWLR